MAKKSKKLYRPHSSMFTDAQLAFIADEAENRSVPGNQALRDIVEHARVCPLYLRHVSLNENISPSEGK